LFTVQSGFVRVFQGSLGRFRNAMASAAARHPDPSSSSPSINQIAAASRCGKWTVRVTKALAQFSTVSRQRELRDRPLAPTSALVKRLRRCTSSNRFVRHASALSAIVRNHVAEFGPERGTHAHGASQVRARRHPYRKAAGAQRDQDSRFLGLLVAFFSRPRERNE
jgi:hypothetical protein